MPGPCMLPLPETPARGALLLLLVLGSLSWFPGKGRGEAPRVMGGVPFWDSEGIPEASRAVASALGTDPAIDLGPGDSGAGDVDMGGGLEAFLEREDMIKVPCCWGLLKS